MIQIQSKLIGEMPRVHNCWKYLLNLSATQYTEQLEIDGEFYTLDQDAKVYSDNLAEFTPKQFGKKTVVVSMPTKSGQVIRNCSCDADNNNTECSCYYTVHGLYVFVQN